MTEEEEITGMYDLLDALNETLKAADPTKRERLAKIIDAYHDDYPEEFHWALGAQSPTFLYHLMMVIDTACRPETQSKPRGAIRLVDRKSEGDA
jgi:hypothetical protein